MPSSEILGKEKLNGFFQARLIYRKVKILDKMKKNNLKTGSKSEKKSKSKIVSTLQEDCQAFGLIFDIYSSLEEAFHFLLPLHLYHSQLLMEIWDIQGQERYLFEITSLKNQKHYIQFHRKMLRGLLLHL